MIHSKHISYAIHKVVFCLDKIADNALQEEVELTFSQFRVLRAIDHRDEVTQKDIAQYWDMTEAAVSRQADLLMDKKFVTRTLNPKNKREHFLTLTNAGNKKLEDAETVLDREYEELYKDITQEERKVLATCFDKLLRTVCTDCESFTCTPTDSNS